MLLSPRDIKLRLTPSAWTHQFVRFWIRYTSFGISRCLIPNFPAIFYLHLDQKGEHVFLTSNKSNVPNMEVTSWPITSRRLEGPISSFCSRRPDKKHTSACRYLLFAVRGLSAVVSWRWISKPVVEVLRTLSQPPWQTRSACRDSYSSWPTHTLLIHSDQYFYCISWQNDRDVTAWMGPLRPTARLDGALSLVSAHWFAVQTLFADKELCFHREDDVFSGRAVKTSLYTSTESTELAALSLQHLGRGREWILYVIISIYIDFPNWGEN